MLWLSFLSSLKSEIRVIVDMATFAGSPAFDTATWVTNAMSALHPALMIQDCFVGNGNLPLMRKLVGHDVDDAVSILLVRGVFIEQHSSRAIRNKSPVLHCAVSLGNTGQQKLHLQNANGPKNPW